MGFVIVAILFVMAMIGLLRPYIGLLALLIVMELQPGELYPQVAPLHLERVVAGLLVVGFLLHGEKLRFPTPTRWFLAFYGAMILAIPLAFWRGNSAASCMTFLEIVVFVIFVTALLTSEARIRWFILTDVLLVDWFGGSALWNYHHGIWQTTMHIDRAIGITSSAGDPNTLGLTVLLSIPFCLLLMSRGNPLWMRAVGAVSIASHAVTIVDTGSRAAALGFVFLIVLLMLRKPKNLLYLPIVIALSPLVWMVIPQQYKARYETVDHLKSDDSYQNRIKSWQGGIAMFKSNPLTGVGPGNYVVANGEKFWPSSGRKMWLNAHSLYFKLLGELGLLGVFTFGGYLICVFRLNFRLRKKLREANASRFLKDLPSMLSIMLCQLLFAGYAAHDLYRGMWFVIGAVAASANLLPVVQQTVSQESAQLESAEPLTVDGEWSAALLPALRHPAPLANPSAWK
ncbi:MAG: O-antigen ligase family protein [Acidobacteriaceae bacterium]